MSDMNIRDFPDELFKQLRIEAAKRDMSLRKYVIERLSVNNWITKDITRKAGAEHAIGCTCLLCKPTIQFERMKK